MADDLELLRTRFADIIRSSACQRIDFWLGGLHVSAAGFKLIASALALGGVGGKGVSVSIEDPGEGAAAGYDQTGNTIVVPHRDWAKEDTFERIAVVHECVHALRDSHGATLTWNGRPFRPRAATDEAAAYVAGCLFNVFEQMEAGRAPEARPAWLAARKGPVHAVAYEVALAQARRPPGTPVTREELAKLFRWVTISSRRLGHPIGRFRTYDGLPM